MDEFNPVIFKSKISHYICTPKPIKHLKLDHIPKIKWANTPPILSNHNTKYLLVNVHVFSNQPIISQTIVEISKKVISNVGSTFFHNTIDPNCSIKPMDIVIVIESTTTPIHLETFQKIKEKTNKVILVKNPYSQLNTQHLYLKGAKNIISTEDSHGVVEQALIATEECKPYLSSSILNNMGIHNASSYQELSKDEITIIKMSWAEKRNKEIADSLCLSVRTIENKRIRIKEKYAVDSFTGVFKKAIVQGLIAL